MDRLTFRGQLLLGLGVLMACALAAGLLRRPALLNLGGALYGLLFLLHPVCPAWAQGNPAVRRRVRLAGGAVALLSAVTRFGL